MEMLSWIHIKSDLRSADFLYLVQVNRSNTDHGLISGFVGVVVCLFCVLLFFLKKRKTKKKKTNKQTNKKERKKKRKEN